MEKVRVCRTGCQEFRYVSQDVIYMDAILILQKAMPTMGKQCVRGISYSLLVGVKYRLVAHGKISMRWLPGVLFGVVTIKQTW